MRYAEHCIQLMLSRHGNSLMPWRRKRAALDEAEYKSDACNHASGTEDKRIAIARDDFGSLKRLMWFLLWLFFSRSCFLPACTWVLYAWLIARQMIYTRVTRWNGTRSTRFLRVQRYAAWLHSVAVFMTLEHLRLLFVRTRLQILYKGIKWSEKWSHSR